jgi:hypothetical protein
MPGHSNNIEIIWDAYDSFRTGNIEAILATMTPTSNGGLKRSRRHSASHEIASHEIIKLRSAGSHGRRSVWRARRISDGVQG